MNKNYYNNELIEKIADGVRTLRETGKYGQIDINFRSHINNRADKLMHTLRIIIEGYLEETGDFLMSDDELREFVHIIQDNVESVKEAIFALSLCEKK